MSTTEKYAGAAGPNYVLRRGVFRIVLYAVLMMVAFTMAVPFVWMVTAKRI